jgi:hypothetical protein
VVGCNTGSRGKEKYDDDDDDDDDSIVRCLIVPVLN